MINVNYPQDKFNIAKEDCVNEEDAKCIYDVWIWELIWQYSECSHCIRK